MNDNETMHTIIITFRVPGTSRDTAKSRLFPLIDSMVDPDDGDNEIDWKLGLPSLNDPS